jgi:hypothetical protein
MTPPPGAAAALAADHLDLQVLLRFADGQRIFVRNVALGMMAPLPSAGRIVKGALVLAVGFLTGE